MVRGDADKKVSLSARLRSDHSGQELRRLQERLSGGRMRASLLPGVLGVELVLKAYEAGSSLLPAIGRCEKRR